MKKAGCHTIKVGVESGSQKVLNSLKKGITIKGIKELFKGAHNVGIKIHAHLIVGGINETKQTLRRTLILIKEIKPTTVTFNLFAPYPGTPFYEQLIPKIPEGEHRDINFLKILTTPFYSKYYNNLSEMYLERLVSKSYKAFYLRLTYIIQILKTLKSKNDILRVLRSALNVLGFMFAKNE